MILRETATWGGSADAISDGARCSVAPQAPPRSQQILKLKFPFPGNVTTNSSPLKEGDSGPEASSSSAPNFSNMLAAILLADCHRRSPMSSSVCSRTPRLGTSSLSELMERHPRAAKCLSREESGAQSCRTWRRRSNQTQKLRFGRGAVAVAATVAVAVAAAIASATATTTATATAAAASPLLQRLLLPPPFIWQFKQGS